MLSATHPGLSLGHIALRDADPINTVDIHALLQQRRYLVLDVTGIAKPVQLTARQLQCLILVVKGYSDELAAETLRISRHTFCEHLRLVSIKLASRKKEQLIQKALAAKIWL